MSRPNIWEILDKQIASEKRNVNHDVSLYPSEASALIKNQYGEVVPVGGCLRKSWFRNKLQREERDKPHQTNAVEDIKKEEFTPQALWKFKVSQYTENAIAEECKKANILLEQGHRFTIDLPVEGYEDALIRGEVDIIVALQNTETEKVVNCGLEVKSITGYHGQKMVFGHRSSRTFIEAEPKIEHLLQAILYAFWFRDKKEKNNYVFHYFKLIYLSRESGDRIEYDISFKKEEKGHRVYLNGKPYKYELYAESIFERYKTLHRYIVDDIVPPRDYDVQYAKKKLELMYKRGLLSKTDKATWESKKAVKKGDWQCSYCPYKDNCYTPRGKAIEYDKNE